MCIPFLISLNRANGSEAVRTRTQTQRHVDGQQQNDEFGEMPERPEKKKKRQTKKATSKRCTTSIPEDGNPDESEESFNLSSGESSSSDGSVSDGSDDGIISLNAEVSILNNATIALLMANHKLASILPNKTAPEGSRKPAAKCSGASAALQAPHQMPHDIPPVSGPARNETPTIVPHRIDTANTRPVSSILTYFNPFADH